MHQKYVNKFHGWNKWKKIIMCTKMFMPDNHLISFVFWRPQIISCCKMLFFGFFATSVLRITSKITVRKDVRFRVSTTRLFSVLLYLLLTLLLDFINYRGKWLSSILLESNFWKRNISLKHTFYWVFVFLFYRPFIIYFYWTPFLVFTCNIPAILLTVFV